MDLGLMDDFRDGRAWNPVRNELFTLTEALTEAMPGSSFTETGTAEFWCHTHGDNAHGRVSVRIVEPRRERRCGACEHILDGRCRAQIRP